MSDMLVKLYALPDPAPVLADLRKARVEIRRALAPERRRIVNWVEENLPEHAWASECEIALSRQPLSCFIAVESGQMLGFACYDATFKNFFGPTGVGTAYRNRGIGKGLLLATLSAMAGEGYAYAIVGGVGPAEFYRKAVGAILIEDSTPGPYRGILKITAK